MGCFAANADCFRLACDTNVAKVDVVTSGGKIRPSSITYSDVERTGVVRKRFKAAGGVVVAL